MIIKILKVLIVIIMLFLFLDYAISIIRMFRYKKQKRIDMEHNKLVKKTIHLAIMYLFFWTIFTIFK